MNRKIFVPAIVALCAISGAICGCVGDSNSEEEAENNEIKSGIFTPAKPSEPLSVSVYLDNSSSMKGYYTPSSGSAAELINILAAIQSKYTASPLRAFYTQKGPKGTEVKEQNFNDLTSQLASRKIGFTDAYQLNQFIKTIENQTAADTAHRTLSLFVTDGILSGTDAEIRSNREFNRVNAPLLRNRIASELQPLAAKGYGAALFQFPVDFSGTYFDYKNGQKQFTGKRPIYVIAIGPNYDVDELVKQADSKSISGFAPEHSILISRSSTKLVPAVRGCSRDGNTFTAVPEEDNVVEENDTKYANMAITFPLSALPIYMQDPDAVRQAVEVVFNGQTVDPQTYNINSTNVAIPVKVKELTSPKFTLRVSDALPGWVMSTNCDDDSNIASTATQTFNLSNLVEGLRTGVTGATTSNIFGPETYTIDWSDGETND